MTATIPHILDIESTRARPDDAPFRIETDLQAEWAMTRLAEVRAEDSALQEIARTEITRITEWCAQEAKTLRAHADHFVNLINDYAHRQRRDCDRKTISVPHGKISSRYTQPKFEIDDETFLAWAQEHAPNLVRIKHEPHVGAMREHLVIDGSKVIDPSTGVVVDGVVALPSVLSITIKTTEEES